MGIGAPSIRIRKRQDSVPSVGTDTDADQLAHDPVETSKELPLDDTQETMTPDSCEGDIFAEVIKPEDVKPEDSEEEKPESD